MGDSGRLAAPCWHGSGRAGKRSTSPTAARSTVYIATLLLVAALVVLARRAERTWSVMRANPVILVFFCYCAISVVWSDYPFVAFKRWTKALGNVAVVLIVLTDSKPTLALKWLPGAALPLLGCRYS